jgi:hypothetical protein
MNTGWIAASRHLTPVRMMIMSYFTSFEESVALHCNLVFVGGDNRDHTFYVGL